MKRPYTVLITILLVIGTIACNQKKPEVQGDWIKGTEEEKIKKIEKQFRGFDHAMLETGYRYQELYWAGQDGNWEYADYQLDKIQLAIENGLERRPKRAKSAEHFLKEVLPQVKKTIVTKDSALFNKGFVVLTNNCNSCHAAEKVPFFTVQIPAERQSPIRTWK